MDISLKKPLLFTTIIVATCSILYELLLAQTLATTMGNTILRYNITVGLYMASLGVGAMLFSKLKDINFIEKFIDIENILSVIGAIAPISILLFEFLMQSISGDNLSYDDFIIQSLINIFNHLLIIIIGLLSGFELPLLMEMGEKIQAKLDMKVLVVDYAGTIIGIILFPIYLLPNLGLFNIAFLVAFLNSLTALYFSIRYSSCIKRRIISNSIFIILGICLIFSTNIENSIINDVYLRQ
jgi:spermidine synthase